MKIRTKLTIFFAAIFFIMAAMLSFWYQYRLFYLLREEAIKNIDMISINLIRPVIFVDPERMKKFLNTDKSKKQDVSKGPDWTKELNGPNRPNGTERFNLPKIPPGFEKPIRPENLNRIWTKEDFNDFKLKLNEMHHNDDFSNLLSRYMWFALYDKDLNIIEESLFAKEFPLKNFKDNIHNKYFTTKLLVNSKYFKDNKIEMFPEFRMMMDQGFYTEKDDFAFSCLGKIINIDIGNEKYYFVVVSPDEKNVKYLGQSLINIIFSLMILICIIIFLGLFYSKYSLSPLNKIINALNKISEQNLSRRIEMNKNNKDEISEISLSINNLLTRIESAFNMEKQFISDVSHEFKTPISILQLNIDNISNNPHLSDEEIDKVTSSLEILYSLDFLIQKLLYLSRLESNLCVFNPKMISVSEMLNSIINNLQSIAEKKNLKFVLSMKDNDLIINGDSELLYIAIFNIVENALKYTDRGEVLISAGKNENVIRITVEDTGIGIPNDKINFIFDKFYRIDTARNDNKSFGIGLTISKRILDIHHVLIQIESVEKLKTKFTLDFQNL